MLNPPLQRHSQIKQVEGHIQNGGVGTQLGQHVMALATVMCGVIEQVQQDQALLQFQGLSGHVVIAELPCQFVCIILVYQGAQHRILFAPRLVQCIEIIMQRCRQVVIGLRFTMPARQPDALSDDDMVQRRMQAPEKALAIAAAIDLGEGIGDIKDAGIGPAIISGKVEQVIAHACVSGGRGKLAQTLRYGSVIAACHARFA